MKNKMLWCLPLVLFCFFADAQQKISDKSVSVSGNLANKEALLELESSSKGLLNARVALVQSTNSAPMSTHVAGMMVYNTATSMDVVPGLYYNDGVQWVVVKGGGSGSVIVEDQPDVSGIPGIPGQRGGPDSGVNIVNNKTGTYIFNLATSTWTNIKGTPGKDGLAGSAGLQGPVGLPGKDGITGSPGKAGSAGLQGPAGLSGKDGITGSRGIAGPTGLQGPVGFPGKDGLDGSSGIAGPAGLPGKDGLDGSSGIAGSAGLQGPVGLPGKDGIAGSPGIAGSAGLQGPAGLPGKDGIAGSPGIAGPAGLQGPAGFPGKDGLNGSTIKVDPANSGQAIITDADGSATSIVLPVGLQGPEGSPGVGGKSIKGTNITIDGEGSDALPYIISTPTTSLVVQGPYPRPQVPGGVMMPDDEELPQPVDRDRVIGTDEPENYTRELLFTSETGIQEKISLPTMPWRVAKSKDEAMQYDGDIFRIGKVGLGSKGFFSMNPVVETLHIADGGIKIDNIFKPDYTVTSSNNVVVADARGILKTMPLSALAAKPSIIRQVAGYGYIVRPEDETIIITDVAGSQANIYMPNNFKGKKYTIKAVGLQSNGMVKINGEAGALIDGKETAFLTEENQFVTVQFDGESWWIVAGRATVK